MDAATVDALQADPLCSPNVRALTGGGYRLRVGDSGWPDG